MTAKQLYQRCIIYNIYECILYNDFYVHYFHMQLLTATPKLNY